MRASFTASRGASTLSDSTHSRKPLLCCAASWAICSRSCVCCVACGEQNADDADAAGRLCESRPHRELRRFRALGAVDVGDGESPPPPASALS